MIAICVEAALSRAVALRLLGKSARLEVILCVATGWSALLVHAALELACGRFRSGVGA